MSISKFKRKRVDKLKRQAIILYRSGLSFRDVSKILDVSHEWVRKAYVERYPHA